MSETPVVYFGDFWHSFIQDRESEIDLWIQKPYITGEYVFQGKPIEHKEEWKAIMKEYRYYFVDFLEWYTRENGTAVLCIEIRQERR